MVQQKEGRREGGRERERGKEGEREEREKEVGKWERSQIGDK